MGDYFKPGWLHVAVEKAVQQEAMDRARHEMLSDTTWMTVLGLSIRQIAYLRHQWMKNNACLDPSKHIPESLKDV